MIDMIDMTVTTRELCFVGLVVTGGWLSSVENQIDRLTGRQIVVVSFKHH